MEPDRMPGRLKKQASRKQIAQVVKQGLILSIGSLVIILLALLFSIARELWPIWLIAHRKQIMGIIGFAILLLILLAPIMVEASSNTRTLSGPGKNPEGPRLE